MIYGIEQTTDRRYPETVIRKFRSAQQARLWRQQGGELAWPDAARDDLPTHEQNFHRRARRIYEMPRGWSLSWRAVQAFIKQHTRSGAQLPEAQAAAVRKWGVEIP